MCLIMKDTCACSCAFSLGCNKIHFTQFQSSVQDFWLVLIIHKENFNITVTAKWVFRNNDHYQQSLMQTALVDVLTTLTCMVMVTSASTTEHQSLCVGSGSSCECAKKIHGQVGAMRSRKPSWRSAPWRVFELEDWSPYSCMKVVFLFFLVSITFI